MVIILKMFTFTYNTPKLFNYILFNISWFKKADILWIDGATTPSNPDISLGISRSSGKWHISMSSTYQQNTARRKAESVTFGIYQ